MMVLHSIVHGKVLNPLKALEVLQNKAVRIILGCPMTARVLDMRKEIDQPTIHSCVTHVNTLLVIRLLQSQSRPQISPALSNEINYRIAPI